MNPPITTTSSSLSSISKPIDFNPNSIGSTVTFLQQTFRYHRTFRDMEALHGYNIQEVSQKNFTNLRQQLNSHEGFIDQHKVKILDSIENSSRVQLTGDSLKNNIKKTLNATATSTLAIATSLFQFFRKACNFEIEFQNPHKQPFLTEREVYLFEFMTHELTLKHVTPDLETIHKNNNELRSVRERLRCKELVNNRRTAGNLRDDFIYFTIGIGDHLTEYACSPETGEIIVSLEELMQNNPRALKGLWVSHHDSHFIHSGKGHPVILGGTQFYSEINKEKRTNTYHYIREDGAHYTRELHYNDEILFEKHIIPGIVFQFILHLRFIGGTYQANLLNKISSTAISYEEKLTLLSAGMEHIMPGWTYPEAKLPVKFSLENPGVTVHDANEVKRKYRFMGSDSDYYKIKFQDNIQKLSEIFDTKKDQLLPNQQTPLSFLIESGIVNKTNSEKFVSEVLKKGYQAHRVGRSWGCPLRSSVLKRDHRLINIFLQHVSVDQRDPLIKVKAHVNSLYHWRTSLLRVLFNCNFYCFNMYEDGNSHTPWFLDLLIRHGLDIKREGIHPLIDLASSPKLFATDYETLEITKIFHKQGVDVIQPPKFGRSLLSTACRLHNLELARYLLEQGANPNHQYNCSIPLEEAGFTALHFAIERQNDELIKLLLKFGANPNILALNGMSPLDLALERNAKSIEKILRENGAVEEIVNKNGIPTKIPRLHAYAVAMVVTGVDRTGDPIVVMGKKRMQIDKMDSRLLFPGGYKDFSDPSFKDAAIRELEEETNIPLRKLIEENQLEVKELYAYQGKKPDETTVYKTQFFHVDVGTGLNEMRLIGKDDLVHVTKRKLSDFDLEKLIFSKQNVYYSNALILQSLINPNLKINQNDMDLALSIQTFADCLVTDCIEKNDSATLAKLLNHPAFNDVKVTLDYANYLKKAKKCDHEEIVEILVNYLITQDEIIGEVGDHTRNFLRFACQYKVPKLFDFCLKKNLSIDVICDGFSFALNVGNIEMGLALEKILFAPERCYELVKSIRGEKKSSVNIPNSVNYEECCTIIRWQILKILISEGHLEWFKERFSATNLSLPQINKLLEKSLLKERYDFFKYILESQKFDYTIYTINKVEYTINPVILQTALLLAVDFNEIDIVRYLLGLKAKAFHYPPDQCDPAPFVSEIDPNLQSNCLSIKPVALFNKTTDAPLHFAINEDNTELVELLLSDKTDDERTREFFLRSLSLIQSVIERKEEISRLLLNDGRINLMTTYQGKTALIYALENRSFKIARLIAEKFLEMMNDRKDFSMNDLESSSINQSENISLKSLSDFSGNTSDKTSDKSTDNSSYNSLKNYLESVLIDKGKAKAYLRTIKGALVIYD